MAKSRQSKQQTRRSASKSKSTRIRQLASGQEQPALALTGLRRQMDRLFDNFLQGFGTPNLGFWAPSLPSGMQSFSPSIDVQEKPKEIDIAAEVPGVNEKDLHVTVSSSQVTLDGEKQSEQERREGGYTRVERSYGSFHREIPLPAEVDVTKAQASFKNGVLNLVLPKTGHGQRETREIPIQAR